MANRTPMPLAGGDTIERAHALEAVSAALLEREPEHQRLGRYVLLRRLGSGAMGVVYSAYDPQLDRKVALKLLRRVRSKDEGRTEVLREARAMARLSHPNVVTVHEVDEEGGRIFLAMEYVSGGTLRSWMRAERRPWKDVADVFLRAGRGLAAAHAADLIHRDFKPENVLMTGTGEPLVADFGLATVVETPSIEDGNDEQTEQNLLVSGGGGRVGTPGYMAPEVFAWEPADALSDQFSFAVALFEGLYGQRPFAGSDLQSLRENAEQGRVQMPDSTGDVPAGLRRLVLRGLSARPEERYPSMDALLEALEPLVHPPGRAGWWTAGGLAVALTGLAAWSLTRTPEPGPGPAVCAGGDTRAQKVWTSDGGRALAASLGANATQTEQLVARGDAFASAWSEAYEEACMDTAVRQVQTERRMEVRMLCLDGQLRTFAGSMLAIAEQGEDGLATALDIFDGLPDVEVCADPRRVDLQTSEENRPAVLQVEEELGRARALARLRKPEEAVEILRAQVEQARVLDDDRLLARALLTLSIVEVRSREAGRGRPHIEEARLVAERSGLDRLVVEALLLLSRDAEMRGDIDSARREVEVARAVLQRYGGDPRYEASVSARLGTTAYASGELKGAVEHHRHEIEVLTSIGEHQSDAGVAALINLSLALRDLGENEEALRALQSARTYSVDAFGPENPRLPDIDLSIAMVLDEVQRLDEALDAMRRGLEICEETWGLESMPAVQLHAGFAFVHQRLEQHAESLEHSEEAVRVLKALGQDESPDMAMCLGYAGDALVGLGRVEEGLERQREALALYERLLGPAHPEVATVLLQVAASQARLSDREGASASYERALEIRITAKMPRHAVGDARRVFAKFLRESDPARSKAMATLALADFRASPVSLPDVEAELTKLSR